MKIPFLRTTALYPLAVVFNLTFVLLLPTQAEAQQTDTIVKQLSEVIITDSALRKTLPVTTMPAVKFEMNSLMDAGDILRRESNIGGIRKGGYAVDPVIRGYRYSQVSIFLDEGTHIEHGCPNRMDPVLAHVEPEMIQKAEVVRGAYLMEYGNPAAAGIRIVTRPGWSAFDKGFTLSSVSGFETNRNAFRQSVSTGFSGEKAFVNALAGYKKSGNYSDGNGVEWKSSFEKFHASADAGFATSKDAMIVVSWKGVFARDVLYPALPMDEIMDNTHMLSAFYQYINPTNKSRTLTLSSYFTSVYHLMDNSFRPQYSQVIAPYQGIMQATAAVDTRTSGARAAYTHALRNNGSVNSNLHFNHGIDYRLSLKDGTRTMLMIMEMNGQTFTSKKLLNLWNDAVIFNTGAFTTVSGRADKIEANATARLDYNHSASSDTLAIMQNGQNIFNSDPVTRLLPGVTAGISYRLKNNTSIALALAYNQRAPDMQERYIKFLATGFDKFDYLGNPQLKPETNMQADLMLNGTIGNNSQHQFNKQYHLNLFVSQIKDYIWGILLPPSVVRPQSMGAPGVKQFRNIQKAIFTGFEAGVDFPITDNSGISLSAGYTLAWFPEVPKVTFEGNLASGTEIIYNDPMGEMPAFETQLQLHYDFTAIRLKPQLSIRAVAEQNRISESYYEEKTPGYVITDFSLMWNLYKPVTVSAGVNNLFNIAYYDHLNRRIPGSTLNLYEPGRSVFAMMKVVL